VRILFLLRHALYLRNFEHPLRDLAARGHEISIMFSPWQKAVDTTLLSELKREYPNIREQKIAARTGWFAIFFVTSSPSTTMLRLLLRVAPGAYRRA
jgi:hypothetical protein